MTRRPSPPRPIGPGTPAPAAEVLDRRRDTRREGSEASFVVWAPDLLSDVELVDWSAGGLGVRLPSRAGTRQGERVHLTLVSGGVAFARVALEVRHRVREEGGSLYVGGRLGNAVAVPVAAAGGPRDDDRVAVVDPAALEEFFLSLFRLLPPASVEVEGLPPLRGRVRDKGLTTRPDAVEIEVPAGPPGVAPYDGALATVGTALYDAGFCLVGRLRAVSDRVLALPLPAPLYSRGRRAGDRVRVPEGSLVARFAHPLAPGRDVLARVHDLSPRGAGLVDFVGGPAFLGGPRARLTLGTGERELTFDAEVRRVEGDGEGGHRLGLELIDGGTGDWLRLFRAYTHLRFPNLVPRGAEAPAAVFDLIHRSGYADLRDGIEPTHTWYSLPGDERLSVDMVYRTPEGHPIGHISVLRVYEQTWMYHQLATLSDHPAAAACRRALYIHVVGWLGARDDDHRFALAWFNRSKPWHRRFFESFIRFAGAPERAVLAPFDRFERVARAEGAPPTDEVDPEGATVEEAGPADLVPVADLARRQVPALVADAFDLTPMSVHTPRLCRHHTARGFDRGRTALVLRQGGRIAGVALCETGSRDLSLFNLMNLAQLYLETGESAPSAGAQVLLVGAVRAFYAARGTPNPLIVAPPDTVTAAAEVGLALAETMGCIVWSRGAARQYRNFLNFQFGRYVEAKGHGT